LSHDDVTAIFEDHRGLLWVGTAGGLNTLALLSGGPKVPGRADEARSPAGPFAAEV